MMDASRRFDFEQVRAGASWAELAAEEVIARNPNATLYTCAAGISPSGVVHFGNFRDVVTAHLVRKALEGKGKKARLIFSWDNFDRFRKVPAGVPESFVEHIGKPLSKIPDPEGACHASYAEHFQAPFVEAMEKLGIDIEYRNQTALHEAGTYDDSIMHALTERLTIADILLSFMTDKAKGEKGINPDEYRAHYYPVAVYSRFTGKDSTKILSYDGGSHLTYRCAETGKEDTIDLTQDHLVKLAWKVDWPMRWRHEQVHFEPGGHDHASPGGSYDVASQIAERVFGFMPPVFAEYKFVGIQGLGAKMSGSKGNAISPLDLLELYEPELLKWLYFRKSPDQSFELAFNSEIYRQYDEYDAAHPEHHAIPFRQAVGFGQIVQWDPERVQHILGGLNLSYSKESIAARLPRARHWLVTYNPEEAVTLLEAPNRTYSDALDDVQRDHITRLRDALVHNPEVGVEELETLVYDIPKSPEVPEGELKSLQRAFFKDVYNLLIGKDTGPRLGTFLWAADRTRVLHLLDLPSLA